MDSINKILKNANNSGLLPAKNDFLKDDLSKDNMLEVNSCLLCGDRGIILDGDSARPCACMKQKELQNKFKNAKISDLMMEQTFANFKFGYYSRLLADDIHNRSYYDFAQKALSGAREFVDEYVATGWAQGLMFSGPVGCGKTYLACSIANALTEKEVQVLFLVVPDLLDELKATYSRRDNEHTEQDLLDTARNVPVLILDDLGAHNYTEWTRNRIYSIINYRLNHSLPVVITTNLSMDELDEHLGERTTSRIAQLCRGFRMFVETDVRMVRAKERDKSR